MANCHGLGFSIPKDQERPCFTECSEILKSCQAGCAAGALLVLIAQGSLLGKKKTTQARSSCVQLGKVPQLAS
eukprot:1140874-Pelagomonas_calceolata.AAC.4